MFVHITSETASRRILRAGVRPTRFREDFIPGVREGVFVNPVLPDFFVSHQWLRELRRFNAERMFGVYLRLSDDVEVVVGHYREAHQLMSAAAATKLLMETKQLGFEVIVPRAISRREVIRVKALPQTVGWRRFPGSNGSKPCGCEFCQRGEYGGRKLREAWERAAAARS